jgi:hypothetical protein
MSLSAELDKLSGWVTRLPEIGMNTLGGAGAPMLVLDFVVIGAVKRSLSLASGLLAMLQAQNMVCSRALLRMQLDTISRLLAYTYVADPESMATAVIGGARLKKFKSQDGNALTDAYLIDRMSRDHPWVRNVYKVTSGYVHFSESQFFDSVHSMSSDDERKMTLQVSHIDGKYPEESWVEVAACFNHLSEILLGVLASYQASKAANPGLQGTHDKSARP